MIDVRRVRVLVEVASQGSMAGAADALHYTPSAVSQQIATLEREVGVALVERGPRSITLTDAGRTLVAHAEIVLSRLELAETEIKEIAGLHGGRLRLATFRSAGETILAEAITTFHERHPQVELTLVEAEPEEYLAEIKAGRIDLGLNFRYEGVKYLDVDSTEDFLLMEDPIGVALPLSHRLAGAAEVDLTELVEDPWVSSPPRSSVHEFTANVCRAAGFEPRINFETNDYHVAQALVASGVGVAFLPALATAVAHPGLVVLPIASRPLLRQIIAVCRAGGLRSPTTAQMLALLQEIGERAGAEQRLPVLPDGH
ncbi:MAG TPA: LysR substrate-binding domain-containing protein [Solirubrobacterales bacterium]|nr:LysR substrate-binding domain-containing protein [Solirubrobacterales bacterium]